MYSSTFEETQPQLPTALPYMPTTPITRYLGLILGTQRPPLTQPTTLGSSARTDNHSDIYDFGVAPQELPTSAETSVLPGGGCGLRPSGLGPCLSAGERRHKTPGPDDYVAVHNLRSDLDAHSSQTRLQAAVTAGRDQHDRTPAPVPENKNSSLGGGPIGERRHEALVIDDYMATLLRYDVDAHFFDTKPSAAITRRAYSAGLNQSARAPAPVIKNLNTGVGGGPAGGEEHSPADTQAKWGSLRVRGPARRAGAGVQDPPLTGVGSHVMPHANTGGREVQDQPFTGAGSHLPEHNNTGGWEAQDHPLTGVGSHVVPHANTGGWEVQDQPLTGVGSQVPEHLNTGGWGVRPTYNYDFEESAGAGSESGDSRTSEPVGWVEDCWTVDDTSRPAPKPTGEEEEAPDDDDQSGSAAPKYVATPASGSGSSGRDHRRRRGPLRVHPLFMARWGDDPNWGLQGMPGFAGSS
ncbi:hypothetical protein F4820DRAFT_256182 [Hypoxylon rubiginosum]|uniref:Uncharacterized protein n=1 Tax=Hypoxylon rubiginosum TaxID=110542 RepID=A0ACB9ZGH2_9PEZI|nr:hypothetical protein F4820DRAFT_256182 [Hypoxylon rubiginosum]